MDEILRKTKICNDVIDHIIASKAKLENSWSDRLKPFKYLYSAYSDMIMQMFTRDTLSHWSSEFIAYEQTCFALIHVFISFLYVAVYFSY